VVEDLEYGIRLGQAGIRVHYAAQAAVKGEMVAGERASRSQRRRWEGGRLLMAKTHALALLRQAFGRGGFSFGQRAMLFDLGWDLLIPPLSYLALAALLLTGLGLWAAVQAGTAKVVSLWLMGVSDVALLVYVLRGWALSGVGVRGLFDLLWAPVFVVWKIMLIVLGRKDSKGEWVRTAREGEGRTHGP
jgi:hypothetical protein